MPNILKGLFPALGLCASLWSAAPAGASGLTLDDIACPSEPVRIVVLGDSLADGLWGSFTRAFLGCGGVEVVRATTVSDGLTRSDVAGWIARMGVTEADLVVVQIGANDIMNIREGTTRHVYGSEDWQAAYAARAEDLARSLRATAPRVIWMGLPIVGQERFEASYREISALQAAAAERAGIRFVDTHGPTTFGLDGFTMSAEVGGTTRQLRATDQVHFTEIGYDIVAGLLRNDVAKLFSDAGRDAAVGALALQ